MILFECAECPIKDYTSLCNDYYTIAYFLNIPYIMRSKEYSGLLYSIDRIDNLSELGFSDHIETNSWLIEEKYLWRVNETRYYLCPHTLSEGEFSYGSMQILCDIKTLNEPIESSTQGGIIHIVHLPKELKCIDRCQMIIELGNLPKYSSYTI